MCVRREAVAGGCSIFEVLQVLEHNTARADLLVRMMGSLIPMYTIMLKYEVSSCARAAPGQFPNVRVRTASTAMNLNSSICRDETEEVEASAACTAASAARACRRCSAACKVAQGWAAAARWWTWEEGWGGKSTQHTAELHAFACTSDPHLSRCTRAQALAL